MNIRTHFVPNGQGHHISANVSLPAEPWHTPLPPKPEHIRPPTEAPVYTIRNRIALPSTPDTKVDPDPNEDWVAIGMRNSVKPALTVDVVHTQGLAKKSVDDCDRILAHFHTGNFHTNEVMQLLGLNYDTARERLRHLRLLGHIALTHKPGMPAVWRVV